MQWTAMNTRATNKRGKQASTPPDDCCVGNKKGKKEIGEEENDCKKKGRKNVNLLINNGSYFLPCCL